MKSNSFFARMHRSVQIFTLLGILLCISGNVWGYGETTSYVLENNGGSLNTIATGSELPLSAPGYKLSFKAYKKGGLTGGLGAIYVEQKVDGNWVDFISQEVTTSNTTYTPSTSLNPKATAIRFLTKTGATYTKYYSEVKVSRLKSLTFSSSLTSLDFGEYQTHSDHTLTISVNYTNTTYPQQINANCANPAFSIDPVDANNATGTAQITVHFNPSASGVFNETLTLNMNGATLDIPVSGTAIGNTAMEWNQYFTDLIFNNPDIPLNARIYNPADKNQTISTNISYTIGDANIATIVNGSLHLTGNTGSTTITAEYAGDATHDACRETREIIVSSYEMPHWQNDVAPSDGASMYICSKQSNYFMQAGKNPSLTDNFSNASKWTLEQTGSAYYISSNVDETTYYFHMESSGCNTTSTTKDPTSWGIHQNQITIDLVNNDYYKLHNDNYHAYANGTSISTENNRNNTSSQWYLVSQDQMDYHTAAVNAINDYLLDDEYAIIVGAVRDNLETAVHATSDWVNARTVTLPAAIAAFVAEYNAIDNLSLANCDGYQMLYTGENKVKILDQTAVAKIATWNGDQLVLTPIEGTPQVIPAHTSVLIYDNTDTECVYTITQDNAATITENAFEYHNSSAMREHTDYILSKNNKTGVVAFRKYTGTDTTADGHNVLVWRPTSGQAQAPAVINIETEEMTPTALVPVYDENERPTDGRIFTIMGIEVSDMSHPGIYIQNGKKFIVY